jgi:hypothetical protein
LLRKKRSHTPRPRPPLPLSSFVFAAQKLYFQVWYLGAIEHGKSVLNCSHPKPHPKAPDPTPLKPDRAPEGAGWQGTAKEPKRPTGAPHRPRLARGLRLWFEQAACQPVRTALIDGAQAISAPAERATRPRRGRGAVGVARASEREARAQRGFSTHQ